MGHNKDKTHCKHGHEFNEANTYHWRGSRKCRFCNKARMKTYYWKSDDMGWTRLLAVLKEYNLTLDQYHALQESQDFQCALCDKEDRLVVDHDHTTGRVRGLLCFGHNTALGQFNDSLAELGRAISYLGA